MFIRSKIRIHPDYIWEKFEERIRATLLDTFGFERRDLGQDVPLSEVIYTIQSVEGVTYVDVELLDSIDETTARSSEQLEARLKQLFPDIERDKQANGSMQSSASVPSQRPKPRVVAELARPDRAADWPRPILPAHLVFLLPEVPELLLLEPIL